MAGMESTEGKPGKIDLNSATEDDLERVPGVGRERAVRIVEWRSRHGRFQKFEDLKNLEGFDDQVIEVVQRNTHV